MRTIFGLVLLLVSVIDWSECLFFRAPTGQEAATVSLLAGAYALGSYVNRASARMTSMIRRMGKRSADHESDNMIDDVLVAPDCAQLLVCKVNAERNDDLLAEEERLIKYAFNGDANVPVLDKATADLALAGKVGFRGGLRACNTLYKRCQVLAEYRAQILDILRQP